jgi:hypothetical protein
VGLSWIFKNQSSSVPLSYLDDNFNDFASSAIGKGAALITAILRQTSAVARTQESKNSDVFSSADFNANGDGTANQTQIQAGLTAPALTNGYGTFQNKLYFLPGYHNITAGMTVPSGEAIEGRGVVNTKLEANYASATKAPMLSWSSASDWRIAQMRVEGNNKASGLYLSNSYYGVLDQLHLNSMNGYGIKLSESAQSTLSSPSFYYYTNTTDVAVLLDGGSMTCINNGTFDTRSVGVAGTFYGAASPLNPVSGNGSGARINNSSFGAQYPAIKIPNGDSLWDVNACYFEGESGQTSMDVLSIGSGNNGANSSAQTNLAFNRNQVAGTLVNDMVVYNAGIVNLHGNEFGVNLTVQSSTLWLYATGNYFAAGKSLSDSAQWSTIEKRNERSMASTTANAERVDGIDNTDKVLTICYTRGRGGYAQKTVDANNYEWRVVGSKTLAITTARDVVTHVNTSVPSLTVNQDMVFTLTSNTNLRISVRGTDGTTRVANITLA